MLAEESVQAVAEMVEAMKDKKAGKDVLDKAAKLLNQLTGTQGNLAKGLEGWRDGEIRKLTRACTDAVGLAGREFTSRTNALKQAHADRLRELARELDKQLGELVAERRAVYEAQEAHMRATEVGVLDEYQRRLDALQAEWDAALAPLRQGMTELTLIVDKARARREAEKQARIEAAEKAKLAAKAGMKPVEATTELQAAPEASTPTQEPDSMPEANPGPAQP